YTGYISASSAGGIVGEMTGGNIIGSSVNANINGSTTGGIVGYASNGLIVGCSSTCALSGDSVGGIAGAIYGTRTVDENGNYTYSVNISDCFSASSVTGLNAGGFVGRVTDALIENSYATGAVQGDYAGGFAGYVGNGTTIRNSYSAGDVLGSSTDGSYGGFIGHIASDSEANVINIHNVISKSQVKATAGNCGAFIGNIAENSYVSFNTSENYAAGKVANYAYALQENTALNGGIGIGIKIGSGGTVVNLVNTDNFLANAGQNASWFQNADNLNSILNNSGKVDTEGNAVILSGADAHWSFGYDIFDSATGENTTLVLKDPVLTGNVTGNASLTPSEQMSIKESLELGDKKTFGTQYKGQVLPDNEADKYIEFDTAFSLKVDIDTNNDGISEGVFGEDITLDVMSGDDIEQIKAENLAILEDLRNAILGKQSYIDEKQAELASKQARLISLLNGGIGAGTTTTSGTGAMTQTYSTSNINKQQFNSAVSDLVQALMQVVQSSLLSDKGGNSDFYNIMNLMGFPTNLLSGTSTGLSNSSWSGGSGLSSK
ncbi:hypothetical protein IJC60_02205, partial [bacterium]|nr:hypothetical protein [bacterium]